MALSGIEQCLWGIFRGRSVVGLPMQNLFGGMFTPRSRNQHQTIGRQKFVTRQASASMAERAIAAGFRRAVKLAPFDEMPRDLSNAWGKSGRLYQIGHRVRRRRAQAIGPQGDLLIDVHNNFDLDRGLETLQTVKWNT